MKIRCPDCKKILKDNYTLCPRCGAYITRAENNDSTTFSNTSRIHRDYSVLFGLLVFILYLLIVIAIYNDAPAVTVIACLILGIRMFLKHKSNMVCDTETFGDSMTFYSWRSITEITFLLIKDTLAKNKSVPVCASVLRRRTVFTVCLSVILFFVLNIYYVSTTAIHAVAIILLVYEKLMLSQNNLTYLFSKVKASPDRPIEQIVKEECSFDEDSSRRVIKNIAVCGISVFLCVASFLLLHARPIYTEEKINGSYYLSSYYPGIFDITNADIPDTVNGYKIVGIGDNAFKNNSYLKTVTVPESVTSIRGYAFYGCTSLESITLGSNVTEIGGYAFMNCSSLSEIALPEKITEIHAYTFEGCTSLKAVDIPYGVTTIRAHAFYGCTSLSEVSVPDTLKEIRSSAFRCCTSLKEIYIPLGTVVNERAFKESPTEVKYKPFSEEVNESIYKELSEKIIEKVYVVYDKELGPDTVCSPDDDGSIVCADSEKLKDVIASNMDVLVFEEPSEFLEYLKKARDAGITSVTFGMYSQIASYATGETYIIPIPQDINEFIESYEEDSSAF